MKKAFSLLVALSLCLSLCACSQKNEPAPTEEPVADGPAVGLANPMTEVSADALLEGMGLDLRYMSEYENARFYQYSTDPAIAEVQFRYEGLDYRYRVATPAAETDISGMHYSTLETADTLVGYSDAKLRKGDCGCDISWYDMAPGVQYDPSCADAAAADGLTDLAVKLYHPTQGEVGGDLGVGGACDGFDIGLAQDNPQGPGLFRDPDEVIGGVREKEVVDDVLEKPVCRRCSFDRLFCGRIFYF